MPADRVDWRGGQRQRLFDEQCRLKQHRFAARRAGRLAEPDAYALWRRRRAAAFDDARRLVGAVFLLAPIPASPGPPG